jgi:hypothetical protein
MSKRHFSILLVISVVVALAVFLVPTRTGRDASVEPTTYLPELAAAVNDIKRVRITAKGGTEVVSLQRTDSGWVVQESSSYPADWSALKPLLSDLSQAEVVEEKTSNPEYYHRLGVEDPATADAASKLVEFPDDDARPAVIVGNRAQGREGQYLRRQGEDRSVLVDRTVSLPIDTAGWLDRNIVDMPEDEVLWVRIIHADGEALEIRRESTEVTDFTLNDVPEGRETRSAWALNQLAASLAALKLDAVAPADELPWDGALELQVKMAEGLQIDARLIETEEHRWLRLEAGGSDAAQAINQRVEGWAYRIPIYKYDAVNKRMDDLLAEVEEEGVEK